MARTVSEKSHFFDSRDPVGSWRRALGAVPTPDCLSPMMALSVRGERGVSQGKPETRRRGSPPR